MRFFSSLERPETAFRTAFALVAAVTLIRLIFLAASPVTLFVDEAQYWVWSKYLDFGYYSKPPMIAWLIFATTSLCGDTPFCVRLGAPLVNAGTALLLFACARRLFSPRAGFWAAACYVLLPGVTVASFMVSTDTPLLFFWALALYAFIRASEANARRWWLLAGAAIGLGFLSKYTLFFFLFGMLMFLRRAPATPGRKTNVWLALGVAALVYSPNALWNMHNGFVSYAHLAENARFASLVDREGKTSVRPPPPRPRPELSHCSGPAVAEEEEETEKLTPLFSLKLDLPPREPLVASSPHRGAVAGGGGNKPGMWQCFAQGTKDAARHAGSWISYHGQLAWHLLQAVKSGALDVHLEPRLLLKKSEFFFSQFGVFGPFLFGALLYFLIRRRRFAGDERVRLLLWLIVPQFIVMVGLSFFTRALANWMAPIYVAGTLLVAWQCSQGRKEWLLRTSLALHLLALLLYNGFDTVNRLAPGAVPARLDPYLRMRGWEEVGNTVREAALEHPGMPLLTDQRKLASMLSYLLRDEKGRPAALYKWNPDGRFRDYFDMARSLRGMEGRDFIVVSQAATPAACDIGAYFASARELAVTDIPLTPRKKLEYAVDYMENFQGYGDK